MCMHTNFELQNFGHYSRIIPDPTEDLLFTIILEILFSDLVVLTALLVFPTMSVIHSIYKGSQNQHLSSVVSWLHRL